MNKQDILNQCANLEEKILISKLLDKVEQSEKRNCICSTEFLDQYQKKVLEDILKKNSIPHIFYGGYDEASRTNCIVFSNEYSEKEILKNYNEFVDVIRITLPKSIQGKYEHRDYLGSIIKLGMKREKTGDIICDTEGADIIVQKEITKYLIDNLPFLTRFSKAKFEKISINNLRRVEIRKKELKIISSSLRIDNIISELLGISRTNANELIQQKRVFINYQNELKNSKLIKEKDVIVIRGKGKFEFDKLEGNTKKNRFILVFSKYV